MSVTLGKTFARRLAGLATLTMALMCAGLNAQIPVRTGTSGVVRLQNTDLAVLEAGEKRNDLPCVVSPDKAFLGFDLRFHAGYDVSIPLKELAGTENLLSILFRVTPVDHPERASYFVQRIRVPSVEEEVKGDAFIEGGFAIGQGKYKVDWLVRDRAERVCADSWDVEAELPARDKEVEVVVAPDTVEQAPVEQFAEEPPVVRDTDQPINVKVLVNFAPQKTNAATLRPVDTMALVSVLRSLVRDPRVGQFTIIAFNLQDQKVLFRQYDADRVDFPALGKSLEEVSPGTIDLSQLSEKRGDRRFLAELFESEVPGKSHPDAIIFAGPKTMLDDSLPPEQVQRLKELDLPIFYMNYILNPYATPWRDAIGNAVKAVRGIEYTISRPRDLWFAVSEVVSRVVKSRNAKSLAAVSPSRE